MQNILMPLTHILKDEKNKQPNSPGMFDLIKGLAMISILIEHTLANYSYDLLRSGPHAGVITSALTVYGIITFKICLMTIFFIISGVGFKKTTPLKCLKSQINLLIIPYIKTAIMGTIGAFIYQIIMHKDLSVALKQTISVAFGFIFVKPTGYQIGSYFVDGIFTTWFLIALFWGWIILNLVENYIPEKYEAALLLVLAIIGWLIGGRFFQFGQGLIVALFLYVGCLIKKNKLFNKKIPIFILIPIIIVYIFETQFSFVSMSNGYWKYGIIEIVFSVFVAFLAIKYLLKLNIYQNKLFDFIRYLGRYSLLIVCVHTFEGTAIKWTDFVYRFPQHTVNAVVYIICRFIVCIILLKIIIFFKHKNIFSKK